MCLKTVFLDIQRTNVSELRIFKARNQGRDIYYSLAFKPASKYLFRDTPTVNRDTVICE